MCGAGSPARDYWITDGLYGSMNCLLYDHAVLACRALALRGAPNQAPRRRALLPPTVFGPTCDGLDTVLRDYALPRLDVGDWLVFPKMAPTRSRARLPSTALTPRRRTFLRLLAGLSRGARALRRIGDTAALCGRPLAIFCRCL